MAKPNSLTTLIRRYLAKIIEPMPDKGEVWCNDCELNHGQTLVLHSSVALQHLEAHKERLHAPESEGQIRAYVSMIGRSIPDKQSEGS